MILRHWKKIFFTFIMPTFYGGGGGAPTQTTSTVTQSSVPDWLRPQTEMLLGAAQNQIFNGNQVRGFTPYSANPSDYVAPFSPMQQQSFSNAAALGTPEQFNVGSDLTTNAGIGSLTAGQNYANQATNPYAMQAWMSPYQQNVTDVQKQGALRDFQVGQTYRQAEAAKRGAYGGSRQAIENAEAQRNLNTQLQGMEAQGLQSAFEKAQAAQQFGANLGLQGYGQGISAGSALGNLGSSQLAAQQGIIGLQNQYGQQQTQRQQDIINQAIQNYASAQQYPMQQLSMYNALLRGYSTPTSATTQYQTAPSAASQFGGLAATALGAYGASGGFKKKGGVIKEKTYKSGGLVDLAIVNAMGEA